MIKKISFIVAIALAVVSSSTCVFSTSWCNKSLKELKAINSEMATIQNELQNELDLTKENLQVEKEKNDGLSKELGNMKYELDTANATINDLKSEEYELVYLGNFRLTAYCAELYPHICGEGKGITVSGTTATPGRTIGVNPSVIPYGTEVYIEGVGWRVAEDTGGGIGYQHIDILVDTHENALALGVNSGGVWMLVKKS